MIKGLLIYGVVCYVLLSLAGYLIYRDNKDYWKEEETARALLLLWIILPAFTFSILIIGIKWTLIIAAGILVYTYMEDMVKNEQ